MGALESARLVRAKILRARARETAARIAVHRQIGTNRARRRMPRQIYPKAIEREYARALLAYVRAAREAFAPLLAELPALIDSANRDRHDSARADAGEGRRIRDLIDRAKQRLTEVLRPTEIEALAEKFARRTGTYQRIQLDRQTRAAFGVDVFIADRRLEPLIAAFNDANVGLIKNIPDKLAADIESATMRAVQDGTLHKDLAKELESRFGFAEDRAKLIARDQVGKLYGQINASRQKELGVSRFVWRTMNDERVRPEHEDRNGETYTYDDPPEGELPGEPINCRCYADPVLDDILNAEEG